jgi:hypothetical protein
MLFSIYTEPLLEKLE